MMAAAKFTVCALLYGDYPALAQRLLQSLGRAAFAQAIAEFRFGLNSVCAATHTLVQEFVQHTAIPVHLTYGDAPYYKYPTMRRMFRTTDDSFNITTPYTMWFDDDSWIFDSAPDTWFDAVEAAMPDMGMLGSIWYMHLRGNQQEYIQRQPWYTGKPIQRQFRFVTGGWWCISTDILRLHNWPPVELQHNGGDSMLGELIRQQQYSLKNWTAHVGINADDTGVCSTAKRRGTTTQSLGVEECK